MAQLIQPLEVIQGGTGRPSPADIRLDKNLVSPHIKDAEFRWVRPYLGEDFYNALTTEKGTSSAFTTDAYQDLWDEHLKELCATSVLYETAPYLTIQAGTNGLFTINNEYGNNVGIEGAKFYQDTLLQRIQTKRERMKEWLCASAANLPDFAPSAIGCPSSAGCDCEESTDIYNTLGFII